MSEGEEQVADTSSKDNRTARRRVFWKVFAIAIAIAVVCGGVSFGGLFVFGSIKKGSPPNLSRLLEWRSLIPMLVLAGFFLAFAAGLAAFVSRPPATAPGELPDDLAREGETLQWSVRAALLGSIAHLDAINGYLYFTDQRLLFRKRWWEFFRKSDFEWSRADLERVTIRSVTIPVQHLKVSLRLTSWEETSFLFRRAELETWLEGLRRAGVEVIRED